MMSQENNDNPSLDYIEEPRIVDSIYLGDNQIDDLEEVL